jgi:hypothetical protein
MNDESVKGSNSMTDSNDGVIVITGEENVRMAGILALRGALKLETKGLKRRGKSARTIAQELLKLPGRPNAVTVYRKLNAYIVDRLGPDFDKPLEGR